MLDTLNDLRSLLRQRGLRQIEISARLPMDNSRLSKILNGYEPMPEGFEAAFRAAVNQVATEKAARLLGETVSAR